MAKIAVDGGGLCAMPGNRFGNYIFSLNLIQALLKYDKNNYYSIYSLCKKTEELELTSLSDYRILLPRQLWMKVRVSLEEMLQGSRLFLALNQAIPLYTKAKVLTFSHGLSYYYFPHLYRDAYFRFTIHLGDMVKRSDTIIVSSSRVKEEMRQSFPQFKNVVSIPFGIPADMLPDLPSVKIPADHKEKYFLYVGMNHPVKNINFIIKAFKKFNAVKEFNKYQLYLVGNFSESAIRNRNIKVFPAVSREQLKILYQKAEAYLTSSLYESCNIPVIEALAQGTPVIGTTASIIPEYLSYVNLADKTEEFIETIKNVASGKGRPFDVKQIIDKFSWKNYVSQLIKLYNG